MTVAVTCAGIGTFFALFPTLWLHLFTSDEATLRVGTSYLRIVGPIYGLYGLGMGLYFASQGLGNALWTVSANASRLVISGGCALIAIYWLGLGERGLFISIAVGFGAYATMTLIAAWRVKAPPAGQSA
jgi:Na+-driven multidrug efflux pump